MDIDKLILKKIGSVVEVSFSSLMDIDKLILTVWTAGAVNCFSSLMDIDKLIRLKCPLIEKEVLVL